MGSDTFATQGNQLDFFCVCRIGLCVGFVRLEVALARGVYRGSCPAINISPGDKKYTHGTFVALGVSDTSCSGTHFSDT